MEANQFDKIGGALAKAQKSYKPLTKSRTAEVRMKAEKGGGTYTYKYADLSDCVEAVKDALADNEIAWTQTVDKAEMVTMLIHSSGQSITNRVPMVEAQGYGPQAVGSKFTYFRRYGFCQVVGLVAEEDDDGRMAQAVSDAQGTAQAGNRQQNQIGGAPQGRGAPQNRSQGANNAKAPDNQGMLRWMFGEGQKAGYSSEEVEQFVKHYYPQLKSKKDMTREQIQHIGNGMKKNPKPVPQETQAEDFAPLTEDEKFPFENEGQPQ